ncbi:glycosyltransferase family 2 protein [Frondihabitans peucedani]|uniref:GT2 family glycosyltransferase n=1 Tax=Frondihabitans peucedani TaxID=598626 RepID=A0ABP8DZQ6_9MICO
MSSLASDRRVTVVVPVYGDLESLLNCLDALLSHLDLGRHRILLVNDCGPDADAIEKALLNRIDGVAGVTYARNSENLGFVGTCNRAATELDTSDNDILLLNSDTVPTPGFVDEMLEVLYASDDIGVVTARSNNATIASLPFRLSQGGDRTFERTTEVFEAVSGRLPRWYATPVAMGFCFLTRRTLIRRFGLFDDAFAPGYGEENDYCLRIGAQGFVSTMANRALVFHAGSKSFVGARRNTLRTAHQRELERRYPFYGEAVQSFLRHDVAPADRFADLLVPRAGALPRVALDLRGAPSAVVTSAVPAFLAAFPAERWHRELVLDDEGAADVRGAADVTVSTKADDDDLVAATVLAKGSTTPGALVRAHRRSLVLVTVAGDPAAPTSAPWPDAAFRARARDAGPALERSSGVVITDAWAAGEAALTAALSAPLDERVDALERRFDGLRLADVTLDAAGPDSGAEVERLRTEIADLRASRTFRTGEKIARLTPRLPGRKK